MKRKGIAKITSYTRVKVFMRDNFTCTYCEKKITKPLDATMDHVVPVKMGGNSELQNVTLACFTCNNKKQTLLLTEFIRAYEIKITERIASFL